MDITMGILYYSLKQVLQLETNLSIQHDIPIHSFRIWRGEKPEDHILYICESQPPESREWNRKLHIGINYSRPLSESKSFGICVKSEIGLFELINSMQNSFRQFSVWKEEMESLVNKRETLRAVLNHLEDTYGLISVLVDKNLKYITMSESFRDFNAWVGDAESMPMELVSDLMLDEHFRNAIQHDRAFQYYAEQYQLISNCYNIKIFGQYEARLLIQNKEGKEFYGALSLTEYVGEILKEVFMYYNEDTVGRLSYYDFYELMRELLHGVSKNTDEIQNGLQVRGWKTDHLYQVYLIHFMEEENVTVTRQYYQYKLESLFKNCCVLAEKNNLCCIWNLSMVDIQTRDIRQGFSVFLRENLCKAGISQIFTDISILHRYYLEAESALALGNESKSTWWYYPFEKMIMPYILNKSTEQMDASQLYHPAIRTLLQYDSKEHSEMVKTAYVYMKCRYNVTLAAAELFIHRTTMLFRLQRIEYLTGVDWENWNSRLHMAVTFELLKRNGGLENIFLSAKNK